MRSRLILWLSSLYPAAWKTRYREEFQALLEQQNLTILVVLNVIGSAIRERIYPAGVPQMTRHQHTLTSIAFAWLLAVAAGLNFYGTVDDTLFIKLMYAHQLLNLSWLLIEIGSVVGLAMVVAGMSPAVWQIVRHAWRERRWRTLQRLAFAPFSGFVLLLWMSGVFFWTDGHRIPTPWSANGSQVPGWPEPHTRLILASITVMLMIVMFAGSWLQFKRAIQADKLIECQESSTVVWIFAVAISAMAIGIVLWGILAAQLSPGGFQQPLGLFSSSFFASWTISTILFVIAAVNAIQCGFRLQKPSFPSST